jgi:hypothetical protein
MPYKAGLKQSEPRKRNKPGYRVTNARAYNQSLRKRGMTQKIASQECEGVIIANLTNLWNLRRTGLRQKCIVTSAARELIPNRTKPNCSPEYSLFQAAWWYRRATTELFTARASGEAA